MARSLCLLVCLSAAALAGDPFETTTPGKPGTGGLVPELSGSGPGTPGAVAGALQLRDALPSSSAVLVVGVAELAVRFKGGILGPTPDRLLFGQSTDPAGELTIPLLFPPDAPVGLNLWTQFWVSDPGGFGDFSASNTLRLQVQPGTGGVALFPRALVNVEQPVGTLAVGDVNADGFPDMVIPSGLTYGFGFAKVLFGCGEGLFTQSEPFIVGPSASVAALVDLDLDGDEDLAVGFSTPDADLKILWNDGHGQFSNPQTIAGLTRVRDLERADFNDDGADDLLVLREVDDVSVVLAAPGGALEPLPSTNVPGICVDLALVDLNADGLLDVALANSSSDRISILRGLGGGLFAPPTHMNMDASPQAITASDFNGDGLLDLAVADLFPGAVTVLLSEGDGTLSKLAPISGWDTLYAAGSADLNADGLADLCLVDPSSDALTVLLGDGNGGFPSSASFEVGERPIDAKILDLDLDGLPDLLALCTLEQQVSPLLGNGDGSFGAPAPQQQLSPQLLFDPAIGDLDGDGELDVVFGGRDHDDVAVARGRGDGELGPLQLVEAGISPFFVELADFNGDGLLDLVAANTSFLVFPDPPSSLTIRFGLGTGEFDGGVTIPLEAKVGELLVADLNGDGAQDLGVGSQYEPEFLIFLGDGMGAFAPPTRLSVPAGSDLLTADLDNDGVLDLIVGTNEFEVLTLRGIGDGGFHPAVSHSIPNESFELAVLDADGDGLLDVATAGATNQVPVGGSLLLGVGDGRLQAPQDLDDLRLIRELRSGDFNADGFADIAGLYKYEDVHLLLGRGDGSFTAPREFKAPNGGLGLAAADMNADGALDLVVPLNDGAFYPADLPQALVLLNQLVD